MYRVVLFSLALSRRRSYNNAIDNLQRKGTPLKPKEQAQQQIDKQLQVTGWMVQPCGVVEVKAADKTLGGIEAQTAKYSQCRKMDTWQEG